MLRDDERRTRPFNVERLSRYRGPKLAKWLRREAIQQFHSLYEKAMLLRMLDPEFERQLEELRLVEPLEIFTKMRQERANEAQSGKEASHA
jgi:hypothetical protein